VPPRDRDPIRESGGFNLYAYCGNDPVNRHDPLGLDWKNVEVVDKYWYVAGQGYLFTSHREWRWDDGPATPENLLLSLVKGLETGAKYWGNKKIKEVEAIPDLIQQIEDDPTRFVEALGINSPADVLELVGGAFASKVTMPVEAIGSISQALHTAQSDWNDPSRGPNYALQAVGTKAGPIVGAAVLGAILQRGRKGLVHSGFSKDVLEYLRAIENHTGHRISSVQRQHLANSLRGKKYSRLSRDRGRMHRQQFDRVKDLEIAEWERQTGQTWPRYHAGNVPNGREVGGYYDAHHIIENIYEGPHIWWNLTPSQFPVQHQRGLHRDPIMDRLFP
jgi:hypothetical protein